MRTIERSEILPIGDYEQVRAHFRARVIAEKRPRRVKLGDHLSAVFENRDTVLLQIQEMLRTERISSEPAVKHELETYNELIPRENELSVTLFVEIPDRELRDRMLIELAGLERYVGIEGPPPWSHRAALQPGPAVAGRRAGSAPRGPERRRRARRRPPPARHTGGAGPGPGASRPGPGPGGVAL